MNADKAKNKPVNNTESPMKIVTILNAEPWRDTSKIWQNEWGTVVLFPKDI